MYIKSTGFQLHKSLIMLLICKSVGLFLVHVTGVNSVIYTLLKLSKGYIEILAHVHVCVIKVKLNVSHYF